MIRIQKVFYCSLELIYNYFPDSVKELRFIFNGENEPATNNRLTETKMQVHLPGFEGYMITIIFLLIIFMIIVWRVFKKSKDAEQTNKPQFVVG